VDHLETLKVSESVAFGANWQILPGRITGIIMVLCDKDLKRDGAVRFDRLLEVSQELQVKSKLWKRQEVSAWLITARRLTVFSPAAL
jgi:hypothetical protein